MTLAIEKQALREQALRKRSEAAQAAQPLGDAFLAAFREILDRHAVSILGGYYPVRDELDILPLLELADQHGVVTALPRVTAREAPLEFQRWRPGQATEVAQYGIPVALEAAPRVVPDALLVPGLAFDSHGGRLGYGGGYYDRTIAHLGQARRPVLIAVGYEAQRVAHTPSGPHDQSMDYTLFA